MQGLSLVTASGGHSSSRCRDRSSSQCVGLSPSQPLPLRGTGPRRAGSAAVATGPAAPRHVGSPQTRARTRVPCISRQTPNHCATREAPGYHFLILWKSHLYTIYLLFSERNPLAALLTEPLLKVTLSANKFLKSRDLVLVHFT